MAKTLEQIQAELDALKTQFSDFSALSPVSYYTHQYSGEEIDDSVTAAQNTIRTDLSQSLTTAQREQGQRNLGVTWPCNPNLLDNPTFSVWQRYPDGVYTGVPGPAYIPDRWKILSSNGKMTNTFKRVSPWGGIMNESGPNCRIYQYLENQEQFNGKQLTLSILYGEGSLRSITKTPTDWTDATDILMFFGSAYCWVNSGETQIARKLELGPTQTLAHQDASGEWVLNEIPDYGEQLRRCRRYCRAYKAGTTLPCLAYPMLDGGWYASAGLPTNSMRTTPTNNLGNGKKCAIVDLDSSDSTHDDMTMTNWGQNGNMLCLRISGGAHGTLTSKFPYYIKLKEDLIMSADL